jgi:predicted kinase
MKTLHIVCGLPATGKTTFARELAHETGSALFDSDTATDLIIQAAHRAAGIDPHDRDSPSYKKTYREPVYETLFALASENLPHTDVIVAGPFTAELKDKESWLKILQQRFPDHVIQLHHLELPEDERIERMRERGALRDQTKLDNTSSRRSLGQK